MTTKSMTDARAHFADAIDAAQHRGERTIIERRGQVAAAIVSPEDLALLQQIEDELDRKAARQARREAQRKGTRPLEDVLAELEG